jgi:hypothetical protein
MRNAFFEWDDREAAGNLRKHDVAFEFARLIFDDQRARDDPDEHESEDRFVRIGMANGVVPTVVYTERSARIRIISARKANRHEQRKYFKNP